MRRSTIEEFERAPLNRYVAGRAFVIWVDSPNLVGSAYFGRVSENDFPDLIRLFSLAAHPALATGFDSVIDFTGIEGVDQPAFDLIVRHLDHVEQFTAKIGRVSIVRPAGIAGAVTAGLFAQHVQPRFRSALFTDVGEAFAWLGHADIEAARARVEAVMIAVNDTAPLVRSLRELLARDRGRTTFTAAARNLGVSERSLSRRLQEQDTSFRAEVKRSRLRAAEALLVDTDLKLDAIAREVGFSSRTHFTKFFHHATGETPSDFRSRRR